MKWLSLNTTREFGSLYESECGAYHIRHYTESLGFGISAARAYRNSVQIGEWTGESAMDRAMQACERHASPIPECDFMAKVEGER